MTALSLRSVTLRFGAVAALNDVSFDVDEGELFAVIGPNGAGKTSLFNVLTRVYSATSGQVTYFGEDLGPLRPHHLARRGLARTFQNLGLFPQLTVLENVVIGRGHMMRAGAIRAGLGLPATRREEREHRAAARDALTFVGLLQAAERPVWSLPYGVRKRVELARALAMEPKLLLLDEPVAGMSRSERSEMTELVGAMHRDRRMTLVLVEHDMGVVMSLARRVLVLDFGRQIALGTPAEVQADPSVIAAYLGAVEAGA